MIVAERQRDRDSASTAAIGNGSQTVSSAARNSNDASDDSDEETDESVEVKAKISARKAVLESVEKAQLKATRGAEKLDQDTMLRNLLEESVEIDF